MRKAMISVFAMIVVAQFRAQFKCFHIVSTDGRLLLACFKVEDWKLKVVTKTKQLSLQRPTTLLLQMISILDHWVTCLSLEHYLSLFLLSIHTHKHNHNHKTASVLSSVRWWEEEEKEEEKNSEVCRVSKLSFVASDNKTNFRQIEATNDDLRIDFLVATTN